MPAHAEPLLTAEDLLRLDRPDTWTELDRGHLVVREPPGYLHGMVSARLGYLVGDFVYRLKLGVILGQDTGFKISSAPDTVRAPDLAYVAKGRVPENHHGYPALVPDLVVEVVSPNERPGEVLARAGMWLNAGARLVWIIDPKRSEARAHRPDGSTTVVAMDGALDGEGVLPGFSCALADVFEPPGRE